MRLRLALLGIAALVPLLLAEVQEHEALRFCSDKEASKRDLFKSYWRKCSTEAFNQFGPPHRPGVPPRTGARAC